MSKASELANVTATSNRALEILLGLLIFGIAISNISEAQFGIIAPLTISITLSLFMTTAAFILVKRHVARWCAILLAIAALLFHWMQYYFDSEHLVTIEIVICLIFFILLDRAVLIRIFDQSPVDRYKIEGAIVVYLITVAIWSQLYQLTEYFLPGSFQFNSVVPPHDFQEVRKNLEYFSFTTLTTLGIGDIVPLSATARTLVSLEAIIGILFPNIFIARLVSLEIIHSRRDKA